MIIFIYFLRIFSIKTKSKKLSQKNINQRNLRPIENVSIVEKYYLQLNQNCTQVHIMDETTYPFFFLKLYYIRFWLFGNSIIKKNILQIVSKSNRWQALSGSDTQKKKRTHLQQQRNDDDPLGFVQGLGEVRVELRVEAENLYLKQNGMCRMRLFIFADWPNHRFIALPLIEFSAPGCWDFILSPLCPRLSTWFLIKGRK